MSTRLEVSSIVDNLPEYLFDQTGDIMSPTKTEESSGQESRVFTTKLYADVKLRIAPSILVRPMRAERYSILGVLGERVDHEEQATLKGYYPNVTTDCILLVGSVSYAITGIEHVYNVFTRLLLDQPAPYVQ
jgi:hypothetical protein